MKNKFELRWVERETGKTLMNEQGFYYPETVHVLQYRTYNPSNYFSNLCGVGPSEEIFEHHWSDWIDVPTVKEKK